jgi:hypothetical protein
MSTGAQEVVSARELVMVACKEEKIEQFMSLALGSTLSRSEVKPRRIRRELSSDTHSYALRRHPVLRPPVRFWFLVSGLSLL